MMNMDNLIAQLRARNDEERMMKSPVNGMSLPQGGGMIGSGSTFQNADTYQPVNQAAPANPMSSALDALKMYNNASGGKLSKMFSAPGSSLGASGTAYAGSGLGGTGFGLGGSLVAGGGSGAAAGGGLGAMLGSGAGAGAGGFGALGSTTAGGLGGMLGGAGAGAGAGSSFGALGSTTAGGLGGMLGGAGAGGGAAAGGSGLMGAAMSNPITAIGAAILGAANYADNKGISSWKDTILGKGGGNVIDYYSGRDDPKGNPHGFIGKLNDKDAAVGQSVKTMTDFSEGDFSNAWKNASKTLKSIFKLKFF